MDSLTVKLYTKKEAQEIINKYRKTTDKVLRMKQIDISLVENEDVPGTFASKRMYIIIEKIFYKTKNDLLLNSRWTSGVCNRLFTEE